MELHSIVPDQAVRDAATVVLLRDGPGGLEVFLVKRHGLSDVLGGAYVFPGGKLDRADCQVDAKRHLDQSPDQLHAALAEAALEPAVAAGLFVAAVREAYEEAGVLLAGPPELAIDMSRSPPLQDFAAVLARGLVLHTSALIPWTRWITPRMPSVSAKRFDTRFFLASMPKGQAARHDEHETTQSDWLQPRHALEQYWRGDIELAPPQIFSLAHLARHASVASALAEAGSRPPPLVFPEAFDDRGERVVCLPGDPRHPQVEKALPGPTRLVFRQRRFEPEGGFDALFH